MSTTKELIQRAANIDEAHRINTEQAMVTKNLWKPEVVTRVFNQHHGIAVQQPVAAAPAKPKFVPNLRSVGAVEFVFTPRKDAAKAVTGLAVVTERESPKAKGDVKVVYDLLTKKNGTVTLSHKVYTRSIAGESGMAVVDGLGMSHIEIAPAK